MSQPIEAFVPAKPTGRLVTVGVFQEENAQLGGSWWKNAGKTIKEVEEVQLLYIQGRAARIYDI